MKKPHEYIAAAIRGLQRGPMSGHVHEMVHGLDRGFVTRSPCSMSGRNFGGGFANEEFRCLAAVCDFGALESGMFVTIDGTMHCVTSARIDPVSSSMVVGLSGRYDATTITLVCSRGNGRTLRVACSARIDSEGGDDPILQSSLGSSRKILSVVVMKEDLAFAAKPQIGDVLITVNGEKFATTAVTLIDDGSLRIEARSA